jgi:hypothetical protein
MSGKFIRFSSVGGRSSHHDDDKWGGDIKIWRQRSQPDRLPATVFDVAGAYSSKGYKLLCNFINHDHTLCGRATQHRLPHADYSLRPFRKVGFTQCRTFAHPSVAADAPAGEIGAATGCAVAILILVATPAGDICLPKLRQTLLGDEFE